MRTIICDIHAIYSSRKFVNESLVWMAMQSGILHPSALRMRLARIVTATHVPWLGTVTRLIHVIAYTGRSVALVTPQLLCLSQVNGSPAVI